MKVRKQRKQRTVPLSAQAFLFLVALFLYTLFGTGCASPPKPEPPRGYELPPALREVFRGGELTPLQHADAPDLGMPTPYDQVSHTCVSTPIYGLDGRYVRTSVRCW
jgi:hypothetical protein